MRQQVGDINNLGSATGTRGHGREVDAFSNGQALHQGSGSRAPGEVDRASNYPGANPQPKRKSFIDPNHIYTSKGTDADFMKNLPPLPAFRSQEHSENVSADAYGWRLSA